VLNNLPFEAGVRIASIESARGNTCCIGKDVLRNVMVRDRFEHGYSTTRWLSSRFGGLLGWCVTDPIDIYVARIGVLSLSGRLRGHHRDLNGRSSDWS